MGVGFSTKKHAIVVDDERNRFFLNGLVDLGRDILMKLIRIIGDEKKTRNIMGMAQVFYAWSKLPIFRWATEDSLDWHTRYIQKPLPDSAFSKEGPFYTKVRCVAVGDCGVGKSSLYHSYALNAFLAANMPKVFTGYSRNEMIDNRCVTIELDDTPGDDVFYNNRTLCYKSQDLFLICCSVSDRRSLEHVETQWVPEIKAYNQGIAMILVGTKSELRGECRNKQTDSRTDSFFTAAEAKAVVRKLGLTAYVEVSAKTLSGVKSLFTFATRAALWAKCIHSPKCATSAGTGTSHFDNL